MQAGCHGILRSVRIEDSDALGAIANLPVKTDMRIRQVL